MILYEGTIERFNDDVMQNCIADRAAEKYQAHYKRNPNPSEYRSWVNSLAILNNSFHYAGLKDNHILVEYELPYSSKRIDVMLFGNDGGGEENVVMLELKQWSNDKVRDADSDGNVIVDYGTRISEEPHPSLQVEGYYFHLKDFVKIFDNKDAPQLSASSYAHNYSKNKNAILFADKFTTAIEKFPLFTKEDAMELAKYLKARLRGGQGKLLYEKFAGSRIGPSKKLLDHTSEMINKQQIFYLIDDQIAAYNAIVYKVKQLSKTKKKSVVIIKGGPGTGKSVIALEVMGELLRRGKKVMHATGSKAFTETLRKIVGARARPMFNFFNSFAAMTENSIDVLIADEAHRIRESSNSRFTRRENRSNLPQIDELLKVAKLSIFLIDENQIVRPKEIGSINLIKKAAQRFGLEEPEIVEFELRTQFRCSGSDAYLQWLDSVLEIRDADFTEFDARMQFRIFDNPKEMMNEVRLRNIESKDSARIVAGFCWPWSFPNLDGTLVNDVKIGNFEMPWENKRRYWQWPLSDEGMEQVGSIYTIQGMERDYIAVIFGNDLIYDQKEKRWIAKPENSYDTEVIRNNPNLTNNLKNVYRVLLSRAHKGVYVYFTDKDTEKYFRNHLPEIE